MYTFFEKTTCTLTSRLNSPLSNSLEDAFPINYNTRKFDFFPFCNENGLDVTLKNINNAFLNNTYTNDTAVLLIGESCFTSLFRVLPEHIKYIILGDFEPNISKHNMHILKCLKEANSVEEFKKLYHQDNPVYNLSIYHYMDAFLAESTTCRYNSKIFDGCINSQLEYTLRDMHFLSSDSIFLECKKAAERFEIICISIDLLNTTHCLKLAEILYANKTELALCNVTNIHDYDAEHNLIINIPLLLNDSPNCIILFSKNLMSTGALNQNDYFNNSIRCFSLLAKRKLAEEFANIAQNNPEAALAILKNSQLNHMCVPKDVYTFSKKNSQASLLILQEKTLHYRFEFGCFINLGEKHKETALVLLKDYGRRLSPWDVVRLNRAHVEAAELILKTPELLNKLNANVKNTPDSSEQECLDNFTTYRL